MQQILLSVSGEKIKNERGKTETNDKNLNIKELYVYEDKNFIHPIRVGYFLGRIQKPIPSQSYHDDCETGNYYVFSHKPTKSIKSRGNYFVLPEQLGKDFKLTEIKD